MPFYENVYYPLEASDVLSTPSMPHPSSPSRMPSYIHDSPFKFRTRHASVDWRRIGAIDVDRLANELDFVTLQENIMGITFCNIEIEKCPHCHCSLDPMLLKLFRLSQYTIEYLLHTQEYLTTNLKTLEEKVRTTLAETEQIQAKMAKQTHEIKTLKEECKQRKKIISAQQMMISASTGPYHKCQHCEKTFMNQSYLQSHMTRRHPEGKPNIQSSNKLQHEVNCLKEELRLTKSQLEAEQAAHLEKLSQIQENELRKTIEQDVSKKFDEWKKEEREKFEDKLNKVTESFMKELKEVTSKNTCLENELHEIKKDSLHRRSGLGTLQESPPSDTEEGKSSFLHDVQSVKKLLEIQEEKWEKRLHLLHQEHEKEKNQLLSKNEKLTLSGNEYQKTSNNFYKKRLDDLGQRLQEQNELIKCQKDQIKELSSKPPVAKRYSAPTLVPVLQSVEPTISVPVTREQAQILEPIQELAEERDLDSEEEPKTNKHLINALRKNPSVTRALREVLEQGLVEKLESMGVKAGARGIPSDQLNRVLDTVETLREEKEKVLTEIPRIRQNLIKLVNKKVEQRASASSLKLNSSSQLFTDVFSTFKSSTMGSTSSASLPRQRKSRASIMKSSQEELHAEARCSIPLMSSTLRTPPFSSDDVSDFQDESMQQHKHHYSLKSKSSLNGKVSVGFASTESESEGSVLEEIKQQPAHKSAPAKPARVATLVKERSKQLEAARSTRSSDLKLVGGVDIADALVKKDPVMELKVTDLDHTESDCTSVEDEPFEVRKPRHASVPKKDFSATYAKNAFSATNLTKGDARDADTSSTLVSSFVSVSDLSDSSDA